MQLFRLMSVLQWPREVKRRTTSCVNRKLLNFRDGVTVNASVLSFYLELCHSAGHPFTSTKEIFQMINYIDQRM